MQNIPFSLFHTSLKNYNFIPILNKMIYPQKIKSFIHGLYKEKLMQSNFALFEKIKHAELGKKLHIT